METTTQAPYPTDPVSGPSASLKEMGENPIIIALLILAGFILFIRMMTKL